jgi:uroporphyrinogen-III synthase
MNNFPTVITTWPEKAKTRFAGILNPLGVTVLPLPMIEIRDIAFALSRPPVEYHWVVFTSKNGVRSFFRQQPKEEIQKIAVIGSGTAGALDEFGVRSDYIGDGNSGFDFARDLKGVIGSGSNVLLVLGNLAPDILKDNLSPYNAVERVNVYETQMPQSFDSDVLERIGQGKYDVIAVSSPSALKNLTSLTAGKLQSNLRLVSIGPTTTAAARKLNIEPLATAEQQTYEGLAKCVAELLLFP